MSTLANVSSPGAIGIQTTSANPYPGKTTQHDQATSLVTTNPTTAATSPGYGPMSPGLEIGLGVGIPLLVIVIVVMLILVWRCLGTNSDGKPRRHWLSLKSSQKHSVESRTAYQEIVIDGVLPERPSVTPRESGSNTHDNAAFNNGVQTSSKKSKQPPPDDTHNEAPIPYLKVLPDNPVKETQDQPAEYYNIQAPSSTEVEPEMYDYAVQREVLPVHSPIRHKSDVSTPRVTDTPEQNKRQTQSLTLQHSQPGAHNEAPIPYLEVMPNNPVNETQDQPDEYYNIQAPSSTEVEPEMYDYAVQREVLPVHSPIRHKSDVSTPRVTDTQEQNMRQTQNLTLEHSQPEANPESLYENIVK